MAIIDLMFFFCCVGGGLINGIGLFTQSTCFFQFQTVQKSESEPVLPGLKGLDGICLHHCWTHPRHRFLLSALRKTPEKAT